MTQEVAEQTTVAVVVNIVHEVTSTYLQCDIESTQPGFEDLKIKRVFIRHSVLEPWLSAKGYLDWTNDDADYKGEHQQDSGSYSYLDYVRDIITPEIIHEYLFDAGRISLAFDKTQQ